jgi:hypothetical protein
MARQEGKAFFFPGVQQAGLDASAPRGRVTLVQISSAWAGTGRQPKVIRT